MPSDEANAATQIADDVEAELLAYTIARNTESIAAIPIGEWCGNPEGDAAREALLMLARGGADVYAYRSASGRHWNIWFDHERFTPNELIYGPALARLKSATKQVVAPSQEGGVE